MSHMHITVSQHIFESSR